MSGGIGHLILSGPLLIAVPVAAAAGAVTFLSPCVLPLVPGYLSYVTGMSGLDVQAAGDDGPPRPAPGGPVPQDGPGGPAAAAVAVTTVAPSRPVSPRPRPARRRAVLGTALFVLGFSAMFASEGVAFGGLGSLLQRHSVGLTQVFGVLTIVLGLLFSGLFERIPVTGRILRPSFRPRAGLAGAPMLGVLFGLSWTPCIGPTLTVVLTLAMASGTAVRGAILAFAYGLGLGIPFLIMAMAFERSVAALGFARRHARGFSMAGGAMLVVVGILEVTGAWSSAVLWLQTHWIHGYNSPL
jgi:cytochrome c-type biogenesis protein